MQVGSEFLPWLRLQLQPLTAGPPEPLRDTVSPQQLVDPDSSFLEVHGVRLHYKDVGPRDAPAVVLLHGFNGSVFSWRAPAVCGAHVHAAHAHMLELRRRLVMEALSKAGQGHRIVAVDRPPFGLSQRPLKWPEGPDTNPYSNQVMQRSGQLRGL